MNYLDNLTQFFLDKQRHISAKAALILFILFSLLLIDNILGFSFSYNIDKKIDQIKNLNSLIVSSESDSLTKKFAVGTRKEIIDRQNIIQASYNLFKPKEKTENLKSNSKTSSYQNNTFWFNVSAGGIYFFLAFIIFPIMLFNSAKMTFTQRIATAISVPLIFFMFGVFLVWILGFMPIIKIKGFNINYIVNAVFQLGSLIFFVYIGKNQNLKGTQYENLMDT